VGVCCFAFCTEIVWATAQAKKKNCFRKINQIAYQRDDLVVATGFVERWGRFLGRVGCWGFRLGSTLIIAQVVAFCGPEP